MDTLEVTPTLLRKDERQHSIYMFYSSFPEKVLEGVKVIELSGISSGEASPYLEQKKHILAMMRGRHGMI